MKRKAFILCRVRKVMNALQETSSWAQEFENLPELLEQNYECLTKETGQECTKLFMTFLNEVKTIRDKDVILVKQITKIGSNILKSNSDLIDDELKQRLLQYNHEGAQIIDDLLTDTYLDQYIDEYRLIKMKSHFLSHAGSIANNLFVKNRQIEFAEIWYQDCLDSANISISEEFNPPIDPKHATHNFSLAAKSAFEISRKMDNDKDERYWLERSYYGNIDSAEIREQFEFDGAALSFELAGKSAFKLSDLYETAPEQTRWMKNSYYSNKNAAKLLFEHDKKHSAELFECAAERAADIYWLTKELKWAEGAYRYFKKSAEMVSETDKKIYVDRRYFAGNWAAAIFVVSSGRKGNHWARDAIRSYRDYLHYYKINNDTERPVVIKQVKQDLSKVISSLKEFKTSYSRRRHNSTFSF
ncbi:MAG: hypothetical protein GOU99_03620 [Candidatus Altiarchaeota archaeon]|nr:hypothetical protein [Candidatus Altiarchaeota archaeon]